jgi:hypothetical protein
MELVSVVWFLVSGFWSGDWGLMKGKLRIAGFLKLLLLLSKEEKVV